MIEDNYERFNPNEENLWYGNTKKTPYCLDYLYFFVGEKNLATHENYSLEYLEYLKKNWKIEKSITQDNIEKYTNFWYRFYDDKSLYLKLASKLRLTQTIALLKYLSA